MEETHKVITVKDKAEVFSGTYDECEEWAMVHVHTYGYMDIVPL
jgi:hypothetical protein